jgi:outer membrane murein-binding lipoprotein Lpp
LATTSSLTRFLLGCIGAVPESDYTTKQQALDTAQQELIAAANLSASLGNQVQQLRATLSMANSATNQANAQIKLLHWTNPNRVEFLGLRNSFKELVRLAHGSILSEY